MDLLREIEILGYLLEQVEAVNTFTKGLDEDAFLRNDLVKNATMMKLIVLGEYSTHIDQELKDRFSDIEWQLIKAARNYYAHVYKGVDWLMVWQVVKDELPLLKNKIENIVASLERENDGKTN